MTQTSGTPIYSDHPPGVVRCRRACGFTLLEVLLVVTIVGILAGVVVLGATDVGRQRAVRAEAERLALAVELARGEARIRNEVWGLALDGDGYLFVRYDQSANEWRDVEQTEFGGRAAGEDIEFVVSTAFAGSTGAGNDLPWGLVRPDTEVDRTGPANGAAANDTSIAPEIVLYPGGEMTPFRISVTDGNTPAWVARSDGIQRTEAVLESADSEAEDVVEEFLGDFDPVP